MQNDILKSISHKINKFTGPEAEIVVYGTGAVADFLTHRVLSLIGRDVFCYLTTFDSGTYNEKPVYALEHCSDGFFKNKTVLLCSSYYPDIETSLNGYAHVSYLNVFHDINMFMIMEAFSTRLEDKANLSKFFPASTTWRDGVSLERHIPEIRELFENPREQGLYDILMAFRIDPNTSLPDVIDYVFNNFAMEDVSKQYAMYGNLENTKVIFDCGASTNVTGYYLSKLMPQLQTIHAFEPLPDLHNRTGYSTAIKDRAELIEVPAGVWEFSAQADINVDTNGSGEGSSISLSQHYSNMEHRAIALVCLDDYVTENDAPYDFLKMDVEGAELSALRGALKSIRKYRPMLAISLYHSLNDMVEIPLYLSRELENYSYRLGQHTLGFTETILYCIPCEMLHTQEQS